MYADDFLGKAPRRVTIRTHMVTITPAHRVGKQRIPLQQKYEYKFIRLGEGWFTATREAKDHYQEEIHRHAQEGWRLVQIFAPGIGLDGIVKYYELILERALPR